MDGWADYNNYICGYIKKEILGMMIFGYSINNLWKSLKYLISKYLVSNIRKPIMDIQKSIWIYYNVQHGIWISAK